MNRQHSAGIPLLFVGQNSEVEPWTALSFQAARTEYDLSCISESDLMHRVDLAEDFFLVIIDAGQVDSLEHLLAHLRNLLPKAYLLVITSSPNWRQARNAFQAGATDYLGTIGSSSELLALIFNYQQMKMRESE